VPKNMLMLDLGFFFSVIFSMYIRQVKQRGKKGVSYIYHRLVETIRTEKGPRQRTILGLGNLTLPQEKWASLVTRIQANLQGQTSFVEEDAQIESLAYYYAQQIINKERPQRENIPAVEVLLKSTELSDSRTIGAESVGLGWLRYLKLDQLFRDIGFTSRQVNLAILTILGRLIFPGSERRTRFWVRRLSGLGELLGDNLKRLSKNSLYDISDRIYEQKEKIENHLCERERDLFKLKEHILIYDLTNTYLEGGAKRNSKAKFGRSKEKRSDCRLITMGLVIDEDGFPKQSRFFTGNQSEPETLKEMILELARYRLDQNDPVKVVIDAGIATDKNLKMLRGAEISYVVVSRKQYRIPESHELETLLSDKNNHLQVSVVEEGEEKVLYIKSQGKALKEQSIRSRFEQLFEEELGQLAGGLTQKNKTKRYDKVVERVGRLKEKYKRVSSFYEVEVKREGNLAVALNYGQKNASGLEGKYSGGYFLRTNSLKLEKKEIWDIYNLIRRIERSFESLKSDLGFRPIYHQKESRSDAHLFISVLAYHLLNSIEHRLRMCKDFRSWDTIRMILSNHTRVTLIQRDRNNQTYRLRINVTPNEDQSKIYRQLLVKETMLQPKLIPN
jgi:transposase